MKALLKYKRPPTSKFKILNIFLWKQVLTSSGGKLQQNISLLWEAALPQGSSGDHLRENHKVFGSFLWGRGGHGPPALPLPWDRQRGCIWCLPSPSPGRLQPGRRAKKTGGKMIKHWATSLPRTTALFILTESIGSSAKEDNGITQCHLSSAPYRTMQKTHLIKEAALYFIALDFFLIRESLDKFHLLSNIIRTTSGTFER